MDADDLTPVPLLRVTPRGDVEGRYALLQRHPDGRLLLVPDTPELARLEGECSTPAEIARGLGVTLLAV